MDSDVALALAGAAIVACPLALLVRRRLRSHSRSQHVYLNPAPGAATISLPQSAAPPDPSPWRPAPPAAPAAAAGEDSPPAMEAGIPDPVTQVTEERMAEPSLARSLVEVARAELDDGHWEEATVTLRRAIKMEPTLAAAWHQLGLAHALQGKLGKAITELGEAARLDGAAGIRQDLEEVQALRRYRKAASRKSSSAETHLQLGLLYFVREMGDQALAEFQEAARLRPGFAEAHLYMGLEYHYRGEIARAEAEYQHSIRLRPENPLAHEHLALLHRHPVRLDEIVAPEESGLGRNLAREAIDRLQLGQR